MKKLIILLYVAISFNSLTILAKDFEYSVQTESNIPKKGPQLFLFNKQGELTYQSDSLDQGLRNEFREKPVHKRSAQITKDLLGLIDFQPRFDDNNYTLFFITISPDIGPCPPCDKQERIINILKKKFKDQKVEFHKITIVN